MTTEEHAMDTFADSYTSYQADFSYRHEQLVAGLDASRARRAGRARQSGRTRRSRRLRRELRNSVLNRVDLARGA